MIKPHRWLYSALIITLVLSEELSAQEPPASPETMWTVGTDASP